tara:strand:- start:160 stop:474 length:315 start_codon:yes stop_codon:yes gene_type:complete
MKKTLIILITMLSISCYSQTYSLLEINAKWNQKNNLQQNKIAGIRINFGWLEDQPKKMQSKIRSVPILVLFRDGKPIYQWVAGIDFKLQVTEEDFDKVFNKLNK